MWPSKVGSHYYESPPWCRVSGIHDRNPGIAFTFANHQGSTMEIALCQQSQHVPNKLTHRALAAVLLSQTMVPTPEEANYLAAGQPSMVSLNHPLCFSGSIASDTPIQYPCFASDFHCHILISLPKYWALRGSPMVQLHRSHGQKQCAFATEEPFPFPQATKKARFYISSCRRRGNDTRRNGLYVRVPKTTWACQADYMN